MVGTTAWQSHSVARGLFYREKLSTKWTVVGLYFINITRKRINALKSFDFKAFTNMIRGKMMSYFLSVYTTDLQVYFIIPILKGQ